MAVKKVAPARPRLLTVAEWAQLPDGDQYELIDGLLRQRMVNQNRHEYTVGRAAQILNNHLDDATVAGSVLGSKDVPLAEDPRLEELVRLYRESAGRHRTGLISVLRALVVGLKPTATLILIALAF